MSEFANWRKVFAPKCALPVLAVVYLTITVIMLTVAVRHPELSRKMVAKDSEAYLTIAEDFTAGDFSMSYVKRWPHRQPLYPLLLAGASRISGGSLFCLGMVNVLLGLALVVTVYLAVLGIFKSEVIAAITGVCVVMNRFLMDAIPRHLVTEPLFVLLVFAAILACLHYWQSGKPMSLWLATMWGGLSYLTRPNGLFVWTAMVVTLFGFELWRYGKRRGQGQPERPVVLGWLRNYGIAFLLFIAVTSPSLISHWRELGNPISHGSVSNYLFVDSYDAGHDMNRAPYQLSDYLATHTAGDALKRLLRGFGEVYFRIPIWSEEWAILYVLAAIGFGIALRGNHSAYLLLAVWMFVELLPLVWTNLANPTGRIPYAAMLPFLFIFAPFAMDQMRTRMAARRP